MPNASLPKPIAVSDVQLSAILTAAQPLQPVERAAFLNALAHRLRSEPDPIGDGSLNRSDQGNRARGVEAAAGGLSAARSGAVTPGTDRSRCSFVRCWTRAISR